MDTLCTKHGASLDTYPCTVDPGDVVLDIETRKGVNVVYLTAAECEHLILMLQAAKRKAHDRLIEAQARESQS